MAEHGHELAFFFRELDHIQDRNGVFAKAVRQPSGTTDDKEVAVLDGRIELLQQGRVLGLELQFIDERFEALLIVLCGQALPVPQAKPHGSATSSQRTHPRTKNSQGFRGSRDDLQLRAGPEFKQSRDGDLEHRRVTHVAQLVATWLDEDSHA